VLAAAGGRSYHRARRAAAQRSRGNANHAAGGGLTAHAGIRAEWLTTGLMTAAALVAFAANSLLCRIALEGGSIDAPSFATIRIVSGALLLLALLRLRGAGGMRSAAAPTRTDWIAAGSLIVYILPFTF